MKTIKKVIKKKVVVQKPEPWVVRRTIPGLGPVGKSITVLDSEEKARLYFKETVELYKVMNLSGDFELRTNGRTVKRASVRERKRKGAA